ncbi:MAG: glycosyltransferase family 39 protein [Pseudomonadota bacterium]
MLNDKATPGVHPWTWLLILAFVVAMFFPGLGLAPFFDRDEGEYATVAQNMIERRDYVIPYVNGRQYYEKPALFFWLMAGSFKAFGQNEAAGRLPSAVSGLALVMLLGWFGRRNADDLFGILTVILSSTGLLMAGLARTALLDMLLTLLTTAALILFYEGYRAPPGHGRWQFLAAWAAMGLAFLTKGPVGAVVPLTAVFFFTLFNRDLVGAIRRARFPAGLAIFFLTAGPWYALAFWREGSRFWEGFFISQNVTRFSEALLGHGAPVWFYLPVLAVMVWPWFFFALPVWWRGLIRNPLPERKTGQRASLDFFAGVWLLTSLIIFSLAATKQPNYILPAVPAVVLLSAGWWRDRLTAGRESARRPWWTMGLTALFGLALAGFCLALTWLAPLALEAARGRINLDSFEYAFQSHAPELGSGPTIIGVLILAGLAAALILGLGRRYKPALAALSLSAIIFSGGLIHLLAPAMLEYLQGPARRLAFTLRQNLEPDDRVAAFGLYKPSLWFYTGRQIERLRTNETDKLHSRLAEKQRVFIFSRLTLLPVLSAQERFRPLLAEGGYLLGDNRGQGARSRKKGAGVK